MSASVHPMNIQGWFPLGLTGLTSLLSKGLSRVFSNTTVQRHQFFMLNLLYDPNLTSIHEYRKIITLTTQTFVSKVVPLLSNTLSRFVIAFLPRSKHFFNFKSEVILEVRKIKSVCFHCFPHLFAMKWWDQMPWS